MPKYLHIALTANLGRKPHIRANCAQNIPRRPDDHTELADKSLPGGEMKAPLIFSVLTILAIQSQAASSSFATVQFAEVAKISLPRNWTYLDKEIAAHLNTSSEAVGRIAGILINQGDNKILVAANA